MDSTMINSLNLEAIQQAFPDLGDLRSVHFAVQAYKSFHNGIRRSSEVMRRIWRQAVPKDIAPHVIATVLITEPEYHDFDAAWALVETLHTNPRKPLTLMGNASSSAFAKGIKLHRLIEALTVEFAKEALLSLKKDGSNSPTTLSASEKFRFYRAFYRAEMHIELFGRRQIPSQSLALRSLRRSQFFSWQSPWVNEQLGCLQDFLGRKVGKAFDEVAQHDIAFGKSQIDWSGSVRDHSQKQDLTSKGLRFIGKLSRALSYEERRSLLTDSSNTKRASRGLKRDLEERTGIHQKIITTPLKHWEGPDFGALFTSSDKCDVDKGPYKAWRRAYRNHFDSELVYAAEFEAHRAIAYVMWDRSRMSDSFVQMYNEFIQTYSGAPAVLDYQAYEAMQESWGERYDIWRKGGRGFWSKGDLSHIVWT